MVNLQDVFDVLPNNIKEFVMNVKNLKDLQEIRLRINKPLMLQIGQNEMLCSLIVKNDDVKNTLKRMSNYSIYSIEDELKQGYLTIKGGHRVGICGNCIIEKNKVKTMKNVSSLNIRICREVLGCSKRIMQYIIKNDSIYNTLIISPPKCGKTTLIRDMVRNISNGVTDLRLKGKKVCVIDERSEICACSEGIPQLDVGIRTDVMDNCPKSDGIMMAIRSMSPDVIACDEIGSYEDINSIIAALNCGINLITSIHGFGIEDIYNRQVFNNLIQNKVFQRAVILSCRHGAGTLEYVYDFVNKAAL